MKLSDILLNRYISHIVRQGAQDYKVTNMFRKVYKAMCAEYTEDNLPTIRSTLTKWFFDAVFNTPENQRKLTIKDKFIEDAGGDPDIFFKLIVAECSKIAENHARTYTDGDAHIGCHGASIAIQTYGENLGVDNGTTTHVI